MRAEWEREYAEYAGANLDRLQRMAFVLCGDQHRAADVVQNTLVRLYVKWARVRAVDNIDAYVRKVLTRQFLTERRQPWARMFLTASVADLAPGAMTTGPWPSVTEDRSELVDALRQMPARQRAVLVLRFLYDLSVDEVADLLDCTAGTVKSQTARGLAGMRKLMGDPVPALSRSADGSR